MGTSNRVSGILRVCGLSFAGAISCLGVAVCAGCGSGGGVTLKRTAAPEAAPSAEFMPGGDGVVRLGDRNTLTLIINGEPVDRVIFDTGVTGLVLRPRVAGDLGLMQFGETVARSPGGEARVPLVLIGSMDVGGLRVRAARAAVLDTSFVGPVGLFGAVNGLVGATILDHAVVELRLGEGVLVVHDPVGFELPEGAHWTPLEDDGAGGTAVRAGVDGTERLLLIDSGAELGVMLSGERVASEGLADRVVGGRRSRVAVMGGSHPTLRTSVQILTVGGVALRDVEEDLVTDPTHRFGGVDGLIGRDVLGRCVVFLDVGGDRAAFLPSAGGGSER